METKDIIRRLGGPKVVGERRGVSHSAVCQWSRIPVEHVPDLVAFSIERGDIITADDMRPDIPWSAVCGVAK